MEIPIEMNPGEILKLDLYGNLRLYDKTWNLISEVEFKGKIPMLEKGNNLVIIDAEFKGEDNSLEIEMKTKGPLETLTSVTSQMN
jgi:hypothetical protein